jgi:hypothetical protein
MTEAGLRFYDGNAFELPYRYEGKTFHNLIGVAPGRDAGKPPVVIGAHYDSVIEAPCADDNAAAVAIALSVAEEINQNELDRDVVFAFFDAEEPPFYLGPAMGSVRFFEDQKDAKGFHAALIMDLVGHDVPLPMPALEKALPRFGKLLFVTGAESHPTLPHILERCRLNSELPVVAVQNRLVGDMSDHHIFRLNGVPYLFLSCGRWAHYHEPTDTPDRLNYAKMERIRDFLLRVTKELACAELPPANECDTTNLEINLLKEALGPALAMLLGAVGLCQLETRRDIDMLAMRLQALFKI